MATQVTHWRATDGQLFDSQNEAEVYENRQAAVTYLAGKASAFISPDAQDLILLALNYFAQAGSPVTVGYAAGGQP